MKALFKKIFTFFLIGVIFISSTGFGLIEHACMASGKKSASFFEKKGCCTTKKKAAAEADSLILKSSSCCETQAHIASIDLAPVVEKVAGFFAPVFFVADLQLSLSHAVFTAGDVIFSSADSSPPLAGRELVIRHHSLRI